MRWTIEWDERAVKDLRKLDHSIQRRIVRYLQGQVVGSENPRRLGKSLSGVLSGLWRYRVGGYRLICRLEDDHLIVVVIKVGHRRGVYR